MIIPKLSGKIAYGCDYNPEQWPEGVWQEDMTLMRQAGVNLVSLGIFSWGKLQPADDQWNFGWLDRIMDMLAENEVFVCLATATASPPSWLTKKHPSILPVTDEGVTLYPGSRQQYSPSSSHYRDALTMLVSKLAERYKSHPALAVWHINNEFACHMPECHGEESTKGFRMWLENKYTTLDALNEAWGTAFWSQAYGDWEEIFTPRKAPYFSNPTQQLDFKRFTSDAFLELYLMEKRILRDATPEIPISTNFMGFFKPLDHHRWAEEVDFTAWDSYPDPVDEEAARQSHAAGNDLTRSLKPNTPFVLMEQASSAVNWRDVNLPKRPGLMRLWSMQSVARGGDGIMFFQWRASKAGTEKFHSSIVQHVGTERSRVFKEVATLGTELDKLSVVSSSTIRAEAAIVFDWHAWWAVEIDSRPGRIDYSAWAQEIHQWFYKRNIAVDFVKPHADLSSYKMVTAPALYLLDRKGAENLETFTKQGGTLLATYFSGIVDENDHAQLGGYPAMLKETLGLWVEEWHPYPDGKGNSIQLSDTTKSFECEHWCDLLHVTKATPLATFEKDFFAGRPALTRNDFGDGHAFYLATKPSAEGLDAILEQICIEHANVNPVLETPDGVEATLREQGDNRFLFLLNHNDEEVSISLNRHKGKEILSGKEISDTMTLAPLDTVVIKIGG